MQTSYHGNPNLDLGYHVSQRNTDAHTHTHTHTHTAINISSPCGFQAFNEVEKTTPSQRPTLAHRLSHTHLVEFLLSVGPSRTFLYFLFLYFLRIKDARCSSDDCSQSLSSGGRFAFQKLLEFLFPTSKNSLRERQNMRKCISLKRKDQNIKFCHHTHPHVILKPRILLKNISRYFL